MHAVALDDPVIPLRPGDGRAEPDLLVRGLFVQDVGADCRDRDVEDAGLVAVSNQEIKTRDIAPRSWSTRALLAGQSVRVDRIGSGQVERDRENSRYIRPPYPTLALPAPSPARQAAR